MGKFPGAFFGRRDFSKDDFSRELPRLAMGVDLMVPLGVGASM